MASLIKWEPFRDLVSLRDAMDRGLITEALYTRSKLTLLSKADRRLTRLRILLRLAMDTTCLSVRQHEFITKELDEVGRMLGGWIRQQRKR